jgi:hypothetical protein
LATRKHAYDIPLVNGQSDRVRIVFSRDSQLFAVLDGNRVEIRTMKSGRLVISPIQAPQVSARNERSGDDVPIAFSNNGRFFAVPAPKARLRVYEIASGRSFLELALDSRFPSHVIFSPDDEHLAVRMASGVTLVSNSLTWIVRGGDKNGRRHKSRTIANLWTVLAANDAANARLAIDEFVQRGNAGIPTLRRGISHFRSREKDIGLCVHQLGVQEYSVRERAETRLRKIGLRAENALQVCLKTGNAEARRRARMILSEITSPPYQGPDLQMLRAIEVLERLHASDAYALLSTLASSAPRGIVSRTAESARQRIRRKAN